METVVAIQRAVPAWLRKSPLGQVVPIYWRYLGDRGYAERTRRAYLSGVVHFARWMRRSRRRARELTDADVGRFLDEHLPRCTCPSRVPRCRHQLRAAVRLFISALRDAGVTVRQPRVVDPIEEELRRFDAHMHDVKGLAVTTRTQRLHILRSFLLASHGSGSGKIPSLDADRLRRFFARRLAAWSPASAQVLANTLRSYVRFRVACGDQVSHLLPVIASPAHWRLASLPKTLSTAEVTRLLTAFPSTLPSGRRAYAIVRCLVDLGLRGREVIGLGLDDIDWRAGTIRIARAKSRRADILPLPATTGAAIAAYVQSERPRTMSRLLFVRHVAPGEKPVGPDVVRRAVREAYRRCGLPYTRVHVLRHTLAGRLLESGSTLKEVADVLRHRDLDATLIYAKIDTTRLASVALPWPGSMP